MIRLQYSVFQRSIGAMFRHSLGDDVLVFAYPFDAKRLFHTFFCPPLRMIALDGQKRVVFDQVVLPHRFVLLPSCRYIIECDPQANTAAVLGEALPAIRQYAPSRGTWDAVYPVDRLLFAMTVQAVADLRRVYDRLKTPQDPVDERVLRRLPPYQRGEIVQSAGFLLDAAGIYALPHSAVRVAHGVLKAEQNYLDELVAASAAGVPWQKSFPAHCLRCGGKASWRPVLSAPDTLIPEAAWRYLRPENAVPLCHACARTLKWHDQEDMRIDLVWGLWGPRFEALLRWHNAARSGTLPSDWPRVEYPLWPAEYGGKTWQSGSGAYIHAEPRPPHGVRRTNAQRRALARILGVAARGKDTPAHFVLSYAAEGEKSS